MDHPLFWQYFGVTCAACLAILVFLVLWGRREKHRSRAMELHGILKAWGFDQFARLMKAYTIGNYIGDESVGRVTREIISDLLGDGLPAMLRKIGWKVVEGVFLKDSEDRSKLTKLLAETKAPTVIEATTTLSDIA